MTENPCSLIGNGRAMRLTYQHIFGSTVPCQSHFPDLSYHRQVVSASYHSVLVVPVFCHRPQVFQEFNFERLSLQMSATCYNRYRQAARVIDHITDLDLLIQIQLSDGTRCTRYKSVYSLHDTCQSLIFRFMVMQVYLHRENAYYS